MSYSLTSYWDSQGYWTDLDPHQDTPVEILHVILLGFVKYLWRDAVNRLSDADKAVLKTRISSLDVSGLGLDTKRLSGHTLVTYAGSLTGRDFRIIAQIAPFVLAGLMEQDHLNCWISLGRLVALVWRPSIQHLPSYLVRNLII
jgi:hypothetical protein